MRSAIAAKTIVAAVAAETSWNNHGGRVGTELYPSDAKALGSAGASHPLNLRKPLPFSNMIANRIIQKAIDPAL